MSGDEITLSDALRHLRDELGRTVKEGEGSTIRFIPNSIEVELAVTFKKEAQGKTGFKIFSLVDISGGGKLGSENSHRVKMTLQPVNSDGKPVPLSGSTRPPR